LPEIFVIIISSNVGETPLLVAVKKNDEIMMQFLLDLGAHPDVTDFKV
jgi:ankyrin repeat protein